MSTYHSGTARYLKAHNGNTVDRMAVAKVAEGQQNEKTAARAARALRTRPDAFPQDFDSLMDNEKTLYASALLNFVLKEEIVTEEQAKGYKERIRSAAKES